MINLNRTLHIARRTLALSVVLGTGLAVAHAQQAADAGTVVARPIADFKMPVDATEATFSSSSAVNQVAVAENPFEFLSVKATQPPPRRGYGRPRYRGGNTNPDGSNKYAFIIGGGFTIPTGDTRKYLTPSWSFQAGAGRNFNKNVALIAQFDWDNFGFQGQTLANQSTIYFGTQGQGLDGSSHVWSLSLNPTFNVYSGEGLGAYIVVGAGFYHKTANFTVPTTGTYCDYYYGCYQYAANQSIDKYTSNAPGFNAGIGFTYKLSRFSGERLYGEARYVYILNQQKPGYTVATIGSAPVTATNLYPANSNRTAYFPVKFGIRF